MQAEANIVNLEIPGELAYVYNKFDGRYFYTPPHDCGRVFYFLLQVSARLSGLGLT